MRPTTTLLVALLGIAAAHAAEPSAMPLVWDTYQPRHGHAYMRPRQQQPQAGLSGGDFDKWLDNVRTTRQRERMTRYKIMLDQPEIVRYNSATLPKPPADDTPAESTPPEARTLTVERAKTPLPPPPAPADRREMKLHHWLHTFNGNLQFTQAYISSNWYQGGQNNLNILADLKWECELNKTLHPKWLFNNSLSYKLGISTAVGDSLRNYAINEDLLQFSSQFGYKAAKRWYYSTNVLFKTQFFKNYAANTHNLKACLLSPAELNVGLGMTYNYKDKHEYKALNLSIAPLSYNLKICRDIDNLDPTKFGIEAGRHTKHDFGSSLEAKFVWKITPSISWTSRLYAFTNYKYAEGDWENTFTFSATKYFNTQLYTHLRYDKSRPWDEDWRYWQFKEILSLGLTYRFATAN